MRSLSRFYSYMYANEAVRRPLAKRCKRDLLSVHAPVELGDLVNDHVHWQLIAFCSGVLAKDGGRVRDQFLLGTSIESAF